MTEIMIVLCFVAISLAITLPNQHLIYGGVMEKRAVKKFTDDLHFIQQLSLQQGIVHTLYIDTTNNLYQVYKDWNSSILLTEEFPSDWEIELTSLKPYTSFNKNGTISNPGTMWINTDNRKYKIIFPFGRNGVVIDQQ